MYEPERFGKRRSRRTDIRKLASALLLVHEIELLLSVSSVLVDESLGVILNARCFAVTVGRIDHFMYQSQVPITRRDACLPLVQKMQQLGQTGEKKSGARGGVIGNRDFREPRGGGYGKLRLLAGHDAPQPIVDVFCGRL